MVELERMKSTFGWKIGLSCSGVQQADTIRMAMRHRMADGHRLFDCVQATWNVLEQSAGEASLRVSFRDALEQFDFSLISDSLRDSNRLM